MTPMSDHEAALWEAEEKSRKDPTLLVNILAEPEQRLTIGIAEARRRVAKCAVSMLSSAFVPPGSRP